MKDLIIKRLEKADSESDNEAEEVEVEDEDADKWDVESIISEL